MEFPRGNSTRASGGSSASIVALLARLATCRSVRGQGLGEALLFDALARIVRIADELGVVAVEVQADDHRHLYLPLATVQELLGTT